MVFLDQAMRLAGMLLEWIFRESGRIGQFFGHRQHLSQQGLRVGAGLDFLPIRRRHPERKGIGSFVAPVRVGRAHRYAVID